MSDHHHHQMFSYSQSMDSHPMDTTPAEDEDIAIAGDDFVGLEEDVEIKAAMATLNNAAVDHDDRATTASPVGSGSHVEGRGGNGYVDDDDDDVDVRQIKRQSSAATSTTDDDDIPVAVPVAEGEDGGTAQSVATVVNERRGDDYDDDDDVAKTDSSKDDGKNNARKSSSSSSSSSSDAKKAKRKHAKNATSFSSSTTTTPAAVGSGGSGPRSKGGYQGSYRSAAAAHRHRQVHVPPIGSPGLLVLPSAAHAAVLPPPLPAAAPAEDAKDSSSSNNNNHNHNDDERLHMGKYLLPSTVFRRSMTAGGYSLERRREAPHRGSSTERGVGDMFDSDAGGLYLHFPELIPEGLWERRLGDRKGRAGKPEDPSPGRGQGGDVVVEGDGKDKGDGPGPSSSSTASSQKDSSSSKKKKDDAQKGPKGARSSYIFFTNSQRPKMMAEFPNMRFTEQGVIMGERWRALTAEEKRPFEELANKDKERHAKEMAEYIESVRKEIRDEKMLKVQAVKEERKDGPGANGDDRNKLGASGEANEEAVRRENENRGPRLVDAVIMSLSKMLGEKVHRKEETPLKPLDVPSSSSVIEPASVPSSDAADNPAEPPALPRRVTPDLTLDELPRFDADRSRPRTRKRPRPRSPLSFLDMIPVSLAATYPPAYAAKRKEYARAVRAREDAIADAQEAKDDADDAREKYAAHAEAWERMLEYQKGQIAKREMERKRRVREQEEREQRERETEAGKGADGGEDADLKGAVASAVATGGDGGAAPNEGGEKRIQQQRAPTPPPEDPMECMPPRPQPPGPARVVAIPDIPIPPTPPRVVETDNDDDRPVFNDNPRADAMLAPKLNRALLAHLDPACFLPDPSSGRYFGLLSNAVADPQFVGAAAPGIAGTTYGGGTGLATSYAGGGRGAVGLVSGPLRGGTAWQNPAGSGSTGGGGSSGGSGGGSRGGGGRAGTRGGTTASDEARAAVVVTSSSSAGVAPDAVDSSSARAALAVGSPRPSLPSAAPGGVPANGSEKKKKKQKRTAFGLATGDRNTTATEIASGHAGDEFPEGWIVKTYRRSGGETIGKTDRFWFSPGRNIRFRAKKHAKNFVDILHETNINGDEDKAAEIYRARGLHF